MVDYEKGDSLIVLNWYEKLGRVIQQDLDKYYRLFRAFEFENN